MFAIRLICFSLVCHVGSNSPLYESREGVSEEQPLSRRSDDVPNLALQTLVQQQAAMIQQQSADIQALQNKVNALENTVRKQVAFSVSFNEDTHAINLGQNAPIKFTHITTNTGNAYSRDTGIFTAPSSGLYAFFLTAREDYHTTSYVYLAVVKTPGPTRLCQMDVEGTNNALWDKGSCLATVHLRQGDQVHAQRVGGSSMTIDKGYMTSFSGVLISADL